MNIQVLNKLIFLSGAIGYSFVMRSVFWCLVLTLLLSLSCRAWADGDIVLADFEQPSYGQWVAAGTAFGPGPARGALPRQKRVEGFLGRGFVNSYHGGDGSTGTLSSPAFEVRRKFITFLIGGGKDPQRLALQLWVDGQLVRSATGASSDPHGSETLEPAFWDVADLAGRTATLRVVDSASGSWGHINVDHILFTDTPPPRLKVDVQREFKAEHRFVHLPIKNGAPKRMLTLFVDGQRVVSNAVELADGKPDWWAPMDVSFWRGRRLTLRVDKLPESSRALISMEHSDELKDASDLYKEPLRGQFHFSARRGWLNDPNGAVFYNGEYHLFFQHNPYGWRWGNMHWGHAVSKDLVHWRELGVKLLPDDMGPMYSGSAVVDLNNTSGFGAAGKPPLVLIYTAAGNPSVQGIAYSTDGRTFTKHAGNPVLGQVTRGSRDPKVLWHEDTQRWVMVLYARQEGKHTVQFFTSPDLKEWTFQSFTAGDVVGTGTFLFECPDFFELAVDGDPSQKRWVLLAADGQYAIGSFDGKHFVPEATHLVGQRGRGYYAAQSFSDVPDSRRVLMGWWKTATPEMPFNQSMTLPHEVRLVSTQNGLRLAFLPVKELESLRVDTRRLDLPPLLAQPAYSIEDLGSELLEIHTEFDPAEAKGLQLNVRGVEVVWDFVRREVSVAGHRAAAPAVSGRQRMIVFIDRTGVELFAADGQVYVPMPLNLDASNRRFSIGAQGGAIRLNAVEVHKLRSAWR